MYKEKNLPCDEDNFKPVFKFYKSKLPNPDFSKVLNPDDPNFHDEFCKINHLEVNGINGISSCPEFPVEDLEFWTIFQVKQIPGLILIRNPFKPEGQFKLALKCLRDYAQAPPNKTNIDNLNKCQDSNFHWFKKAQSDPSLLSKLRWATIGYHHNWDTKVYSRDDVTKIPYELAQFSKFTVDKILSDPFYEPEAGIVNFYPMDSCLYGHTDHSEVNIERPLLSISLGQSAVFLIGGTTKAKRPIPILLQSGDVLLMTEESRRCFHAVPKIVKVESQPWIDEEANSKGLQDDEVEFVKKYLTDHRININIRQVF